MNGVEAMVKMAAGRRILEAVEALLRARDGEFAELEQAYLSAVQSVKGMEQVLAVRQRQIVGDLWFAGWRGMQLCLDIFRTPMGAGLLKLDYGELLREHIMIAMPGHREAERELGQLLGCLTPAQRQVLEPVDEYYAHLETVGLKIAHYLGLRMGEALCPMVEPGYASDTAAMYRYRRELEQYLGFALD